MAVVWKTEKQEPEKVPKGSVSEGRLGPEPLEVSPPSFPPLAPDSSIPPEILQKRNPSSLTASLPDLANKSAGSPFTFKFEIKEQW